MKDSLNFRQIEGRNSVIEVLKSPCKVLRVFVDQQAKGEKIEKILFLARKKDTPVIKKPRRLLDRIAKTGVCQGVIAHAESLPLACLDSILKKIYQTKKIPFFVILPETLYEHNLGAVIRTCEAANVDGVIISKRSKGITPIVNRISMGAVEYIPIVQSNLFQTIRRLKEDGCKIIGASPNKGKPYFKENLKVPLALVIGGEDRDIKSSLDERIDCFVRIPMFGRITSLNLSAAAAIIIFETIRQRKM